LNGGALRQQQAASPVAVASTGYAPDPFRGKAEIEGVIGIAGRPVAVGGPAISSSNTSGSITAPIAAWRVTNTSTGGSVTVTARQAGIG